MEFRDGQIKMIRGLGMYGGRQQSDNGNRDKQSVHDS